MSHGWPARYFLRSLPLVSCLEQSGLIMLNASFSESDPCRKWIAAVETMMISTPREMPASIAAG
jgi:hypothetical protein